MIIKGEQVDAWAVTKIFTGLPGNRLILEREERSGGGDPWMPVGW